MARPIWKGFITFGLVNIPVILYSAETKSAIQFKMVDSRDKGKIHYQRINENTGKPVSWEDVAKGFEYDHDVLLVKEEDLKKIAGENSKTINIENFVNQNEIDYMYYERPYYLVPDKKGEKGYVILRETLKNLKKVGITKVIIHSREYLAALIPNDNALILNILRYAQELRPIEDFEMPANTLKAYKVTPKEMEVAKQLVSSMTTRWQPEEYKDEFQVALESWIEAKIHHKTPKKTKQAPVKKSNVINFVDLLKKSIDAKKNQKSTPKRARAHKK